LLSSPKSGRFYSLFRQSTNCTNSRPKWRDECEFCSFWITWSTFQNSVETWPSSKVSANEFSLIAFHWLISKSKMCRHI